MSNSTEHPDKDNEDPPAGAEGKDDTPIQGTAPFALVDALLKRPFDLATKLRENATAPALIFLGLMLGSSLVFGLVLGSFSGGMQWWASPAKIAGGLAVAGLICFPSLYILSCLGGADIRVGHLARGLAAALALIGVLLVGFTPIVWIFSQSTDSLGFLGTIVLATWLVSLWFGLGFLKRLFLGERAEKLGSFRVWACLFALVTLQMSTALRPILGSDDSFFPEEKKFFVQHWIESLTRTIPSKTAKTQAGVSTRSYAHAEDGNRSGR